jgi:hypothetical protein
MRITRRERLRRAWCALRCRCFECGLRRPFHRLACSRSFLAEEW